MAPPFADSVRAMKHIGMVVVSALALPLGACSSSKGTSVDAHSADAGIDRGPTNTPLMADPNGLYWDATKKTLYIADQEGNQILTWTDAGGFGPTIALTAAPSGDTELGGLWETADGTLLTPRFGFGTIGGLIEVEDGSASTVPNLDVTRRRLGVSVAPDGTVFDTYFVKTTTTVGALATVDLTAGTEADFITGLTKPVGIAVIPPNVYVSDQGTNEILMAPLGGSASAGTMFSDPIGPDLMAPGPNGSIFSGSTVGNVYQIDSSGTSTTFQTGFNETRGMAYDAVNERLFVAEHVASGTVHALHIFPVTP